MKTIHIKLFLLIVIFIIGIISINCNIFDNIKLSNQLSINYNNLISKKSNGTELLAPAKGMVCIEGNTNTVLYSYNDNLKLPMASTTKIITAIVTIDNCDDLDKEITISSNSVGIEGTSIYLKTNEKISIKNLLYGLILASGNDCAVALAEHFGGENNFINMCNNFIKDLGLNNTNIINPHGLDENNHYTTAYDLAIITSYALNNSVFREICNTKRYTMPATNVSDVRYLKNKNKLIFDDENCIGVKTGFTDNAGRCLVNAHKENGMTIISVVLNCQPMFEECNRLTNLALNEFIIKEFVQPYNYVTDVSVVDGDKNFIALTTLNSFSKVVKKSEIDNYKVEYDVPNNIDAPVKINQVIGRVIVKYNDEIIYEDNLYATDSTKNVEMKYYLNQVLDNWLN